MVDGTAELERDGQRQTAEENVPLLAGDRLRTARGRVEILFSDGSALALDQDTDVDLLSDSLLRVQAGRIRLAIARGAAELAYRVDAAGTTTWIRSAGEYRIVVDNRSAEPDVLVTVLRGAAELESAGGRTLVRTGFEARANARNAPSLPYAANVAAWDTFDRWVEDQQRYRTSARSAQYLPTELRHYGGAFDHDGSWEHEQGYGYVWYPLVAVDWRPYYNGGWSHYGSFGWTWVGGGRWTWPTHHYGRWGLRTGRWFWIPGRRWGPAWVSWASAPGYLGWCPLGFDNRPVISATHINNYYGGDRRHGWTVVPSNRFGSRVAVNRSAVSPQTLSEGRFTLHTSSPVRPSVSARQIEPLRAPTYSGSGGRYAVPRLATSSPSASIATSPSSVGSDETRSAVARSRVAPTAGRPSNPVTRPSGPDEDPSDRPSTVSTGPRSRSAPSASPGGDSGAADRPATVRTATPRSPSNPSQGPAPAAGPSGGSSSGQSSGHAVGGRRSMSSGTGTVAIRAADHQPSRERVTVRERPGATNLWLLSGRSEQRRGAEHSFTGNRSPAGVSTVIRTRTANRANGASAADAGGTEHAEPLGPNGPHAIDSGGAVGPEPIRRWRAKQSLVDTRGRKPRPGAQSKRPLTRSPVAVHC